MKSRPRARSLPAVFFAPCPALAMSQAEQVPPSEAVAADLVQLCSFLATHHYHQFHKVDFATNSLGSLIDPSWVDALDGADLAQVVLHGMVQPSWPEELQQLVSQAFALRSVGGAFSAIETQPLSSALSRNMTPKKCYEVRQMAHHTELAMSACSCRRIIDVGAGKG